MELSPPGDCQSGMAPGGVVPSHRIHRHQSESVGKTSGAFYNQRGTAEQWIKEGKNAIRWTRLSCHDFVDNEVRLLLFVLAYNLGNYLRQAVLPRSVSHWSLTTLREKLIKIGAKVVTHARRVIFQMAEVAVPRELFQSILKAIDRLRLPLSASG